MKMQTSEASKETNKEKAKGNVSGADSLTDRATGTVDAVGDKLDQKKHEGSAKGIFPNTISPSCGLHANNYQQQPTKNRSRFTLSRR